MANEVQSLRTVDRLRSKMTMEFVKAGKDARGVDFVMRADLPVGRGFNEKGLPQEYINLGWEPASVYDARINSEKAAVKREAAKVEAKK